ncbi:hypothetical protein AT575_05190 [Streptococcus penaeicida]|uniref:Uncharacterized protein n=1 Tax=Streptococcus penaeicida TaxID=1765960 RepID=A0A2N8LC95_9STRE|nr:DUF3923 family protein [Streptococcus penaeicida]PND47785.1 hypothetical protein AT575_05190 [Streptococcus penaeicida]
MKKFFLLGNLILFCLVVIVALFLWFRNTDGTGAIQTAGAKMVTELVWFIFYFIILALQALFLLIKKAFSHDR